MPERDAANGKCAATLCCNFSGLYKVEFVAFDQMSTFMNRLHVLSVLRGADDFTPAMDTVPAERVGL